MPFRVNAVQRHRIVQVLFANRYRILIDREQLCKMILQFFVLVLALLVMSQYARFLVHNVPLFLNAPDDQGFYPDLVVAKDGSGNYRTVSEAVAAVPNFDKERFRIAVKAGVYHENVVVGPEKTNVMLIGAGKGLTVITSNLSEAAGWKPAATATMSISGDGFVALYMSFENTAGRSSGYGVAVRSVSDKSAFYQCSFTGDQGTLYADSGRQLYVECEIAGGRDVILGGGRAIFHNGTLYARAPRPGKDVILTANRRSHWNSPEGFVFRQYTVKAAAGGVDEVVLLPRSTEVYLGRPLGSYSRVVFLRSFLDHVVSPAGWRVGGGKPSPATATVYYGEYQNTGPGADSSGRVAIPGVRKTMTADEAATLAGLTFIDGDTWLPSIGIPILYDSLGNNTSVS
ncbi:hypothetical protein H6P81_015263 [Aristolochia fimbriata]|uniref:Pectinesterase catalytic domain-containing protein n=1 Tax=Aristolochia fimbriata TaxID=158543 RepID=A0AAV7E5M6_ARIFI|nr:hypothetical protein H6P81_015263 [Aristolochia fimbriata]